MKSYLYTPGPTPVPSEALLAMARPVSHHREPAFKELFAQVCKDLQYLMQTQQRVLVFAASGSGAMEAAVVNTLSAGDKVAVVQGGKFGQRWDEICRGFGVEVVPIDVPWGTAVRPEQVEECLRANGDIKAVLTTLCETSTCVLTDIRAIGKIVKNRDALLIVDAISGLGADDLRHDEWGVDVTVSASQKAVMVPPGLSFVALSEKAVATRKRSDLPKYYWSFEKMLKSMQSDETAFTPAVSLVYGLSESLRRIRSEGLDQVLARHARLAEATRAAVRGLELKLFSQAPSNVATAVEIPENIDGLKLKARLTERFGVTVAGGQDRLKGKIIRIAHVGYAGAFDVITVISALEMILWEMGFGLRLGAGIEAAEKVLLDNE